MANLSNLSAFSRAEYDDLLSLPESLFYCIFLAIGNTIGLIGNAFVIYASFKYGTFQMDKITILFVRHLAIADIIFIIIYLTPMLITHCFHAWVLGELLCKITGYICSIPVTANINFIMAVSIHRFMRCRYPAKAQLLTMKRAHVLTVALWLLSCTLIIYTIVKNMQIQFFVQLGGCQFEFDKTHLNMILITLTTAIPFVLITAINIGLWIYVQTFISTTSKSRHALITTFSITALFIITWFPTVVRFEMSAIMGEAYIPNWLEKARYIYFVGTYSNPIIYTMVNKRFRDFISMRWKRISTQNDHSLNSTAAPEVRGTFWDTFTAKKKQRTGSLECNNAKDNASDGRAKSLVNSPFQTAIVSSA